MLIEFSVTNFKSIKETQTLSMVVANWLKEKESLEAQTFSIKDPKTIRLLNSAAIYGANAAGKSNIIEAMQFMERFIVKSHKGQEGEEIKNLAPFLFNKKSRSAPSEFEAIFINDNIRYQYGFSVNNERVMHEWLFVHSLRATNKPLFERKYNVKNKEYEWDLSKLKGQREIIKKATRSNALFLSTAIQLNNEQSKPVFNWFQQKLVAFGATSGLAPIFSMRQCETAEKKQKIMEFVQYADQSINDLRIESKKFSKEDLPKDMPQYIKEEFIKELDGKDIFSMKLLHPDNKQEMIELDLDDESQGTQYLFALAGPLLDVIKKGRILVVDEIHNSMHPLLVRFLIRIFHNPRINKHNAQLIFTTHDTTILDNDIFRRDQIWFVEKDKENATRLYPLSDFKPRKDEALGKGYLRGRYGAIPYFGELIE